MSDTFKTEPPQKPAPVSLFPKCPCFSNPVSAQVKEKEFLFAAMQIRVLFEDMADALYACKDAKPHLAAIALQGIASVVIGDDNKLKMRASQMTDEEKQASTYLFINVIDQIAELAKLSIIDTIRDGGKRAKT